MLLILEPAIQVFKPQHITHYIFSWKCESDQTFIWVRWVFGCWWSEVVCQKDIKNVLYRNFNLKQNSIKIMPFAACKKQNQNPKWFLVSQDITHICRFWKRIKSQTSKMVRTSLARITATELPSCHSSYTYWRALSPPKLEAGRLCMLKAALFCILLSWIQESSHQCHFPVSDHFLTRLLHILNYCWMKRKTGMKTCVYKFFHVWSFFPQVFFF